MFKQIHSDVILLPEIGQKGMFFHLITQHMEAIVGSVTQWHHEICLRWKTLVSLPSEHQSNSKEDARQITLYTRHFLSKFNYTSNIILYQLIDTFVLLMTC